jgi:hypothetical protein
MVPEDFAALVLKADAFWYLERWDDCKSAYWDARKLKPRNDHVNKRYWRCKARAKQSKN